MMDAGYQHNDLIRALGGKAKLADALGLDRDVLSKWHVRGIPSKYWHEVIRLAVMSNVAVDITASDLARTKPDASKAA